MYVDTNCYMNSLLICLAQLFNKINSDNKLGLTINHSIQSKRLLKKSKYS